MITGRQIREARKLTGLRRYQLAYATKIITTVKLAKVEASDDEADLTLEQAEAIQRAFEAVGVELIAGNGGGAGMSLRKGGQAS